MLADDNNKQALKGDHDLWESFKSDDQQAYGQIYKNHSESLYKYGMQLCGNTELVEDTIHDIFVDIWEKRGRLSEVKSIRLYLKFSLRRNLFRKLKKSNLLQGDEVLHKNAFKFSIQEENFAKEADDYLQMENKLLQVLNDLSPRQREVIYLRFYQDLTYEEISSLLSLDVGYVYNVSSRAYAKIRSSLCSGILVLMFFA
jgi:RNA polymerase sigma factor (sigma-70 family)